MISVFLSLKRYLWVASAALLRIVFNVEAKTSRWHWLLWASVTLLSSRPLACPVGLKKLYYKNIDWTLYYSVKIFPVIPGHQKFVLVCSWTRLARNRGKWHKGEEAYTQHWVDTGWRWWWCVCFAITRLRLLLKYCPRRSTLSFQKTLARPFRRYLFRETVALGRNLKT